MDRLLSSSSRPASVHDEDESSLAPPNARFTVGVYDHRMGEILSDDLAAFILAGGKSSRMGQDKSSLQLGGETLLKHCLKIASQAAESVRIVGDRPEFEKFATTVEDVHRDCGPLGGIHAALAHSQCKWNLMLAVDLPFVEAGFLKYLTIQARESGAMVTIPRAGGGWQPLCAIYRQDFVSVAEKALQSGNNKIDPLFREIDMRIVEKKEILEAGFSPRMFCNVNTPAEWEEAVSHYRQQIAR